MSTFLWILGSVPTFALVALTYACIEVAHEDDERAERDIHIFTARTCPTCRHHLGGGQCRQSLEKECMEGGGFEAWEPK